MLIAGSKLTYIINYDGLLGLLLWSLKTACTRVAPLTLTELTLIYNSISDSRIRPIVSEVSQLYWKTFGTTERQALTPKS